ncbi:hypothetical protein SAMN05216388_101113 [Halorientalis persicus]|jgi:hypothetical protein|uniref:Metal-binding protein n=1 Tax=Halorientalis persicus TaxID=1367881 RepID=A0A1H8NQE6_9EURY|nr:UPF0058 family protein [Halorientalis persicus]SEO31854.1 hypothetical protein SAMN05216388_101113 [Halorientalis persicus]
MRKDEFLHLHQLLAVTQRTLAARGVSDADTDTDTGTVSPVAAHASKADHERAVMTLAATLATVTADESDAAGNERDRARQAPK